MTRKAILWAAVCGLSLGTAAFAVDQGGQQQYGQTGQQFRQTGQQDQQVGQKRLHTGDRGFDAWYDQQRQQQPMLMGQYPGQQQQPWQQQQFQQPGQQQMDQQRWQQQQRMQQQRMQQQLGQRQPGQQQQQQFAQQFMQMGQVPLIAGRLVDTREVTIQELDATHLLVRIQTAEGFLVVDLGDRDRIRDEISLERDRWLGVSGRVGYIDNRQVLIADRVAKVVPIQRDRQAQTGQVFWQADDQEIWQEDEWEIEDDNDNGNGNGNG